MLVNVQRNTRRNMGNDGALLGTPIHEVSGQGAGRDAQPSPLSRPPPGAYVGYCCNVSAKTLTYGTLDTAVTLVPKFR